MKVLQVGLCSTDKDLYLGEYGNPPYSGDYLVIGHESLGRVVEIGEHVDEFACGDLVVATVRRPGGSIYDRIGAYDMTTDDVFYERGISFAHGFLTEYYAESADHLVGVPHALRDVALLLEPMSVVQKGIQQVYEIQRRLKVWKACSAAVVGVGTIGLLTTSALRLRNIDTICLDVLPKLNLKATLVEEIGARYVDTSSTTLDEASRAFGPFDLILEASGDSTMVYKSASALAKNGVLAVFSIPNGHARTEIGSDRLTLEFVLGNKATFGTVNANRGHFKSGIADFAHSEVRWAGWLSRLLTHPTKGLENCERAFSQLLQPSKARIKAYVIVAEA